jgi:short-subunit dehydrogenase
MDTDDIKKSIPQDINDKHIEYMRNARNKHFTDLQYKKKNMVNNYIYQILNQGGSLTTVINNIGFHHHLKMEKLFKKKNAHILNSYAEIIIKFTNKYEVRFNDDNTTYNVVTKEILSNIFDDELVNAYWNDEI